MQANSSPEVLDAPADTVIDTDSVWQLLLYNDDIHSFPQVISAVMYICKHPKQLAEHLVTQAHKNGREVIDVGEKEDILRKKQLFQSAQFTVEAEQI